MSATPVDAYIEAQPAEAQPHLRALAALIREEAPEATERLAYGLATWFLNGNLVHIGGFRQHVGLYPGPSGVAAFAEELAGYKTSKGAIQLPFSGPVPEELVRRIVRHRVAENRVLPAKRAPKG